MPSLLTDDGLRHFGAAVTANVGDEAVPGLVAVVARGDEVHVEVQGSLSIGGPPVRRDTQFRIASTTKPITAAAVLALADEGLLELDEPVDRLLPELADRRVLRRVDGPLEDTVAARRQITVRDLLAFTCGFGMVLEMFTSPQPWPVVAATNELELATIGPPQPQLQPDPDTWIARLGSLPLVTQPGERWMYNTGTQAAGVLAARAAKMPLPEVMRTRLFEPLGMRDTAFYASDPSRLPTSYIPTPDGLQVWDEPEGQWSTPPRFADGAAGLVSTADDLLAFARMLLAGGEPVLSRRAVEEMTRDQLTAEQKAHGGLGDTFFAERGWGLGGSVMTAGPRKGAYGWDGGLGTSWLVDFERDLVVIVLTQRMFETATPPKVHDELQAAAYAALPG